MLWHRFRSERAKTATVFGLAFIFMPLVLSAVFLIIPGGGFLIALLMAGALQDGSLPWMVWLPLLIGDLLLGCAVVDETRARRDNDY